MCVQLFYCINYLNMPHHPPCPLLHFFCSLASFQCIHKSAHTLSSFNCDALLLSRKEDVEYYMGPGTSSARSSEAASGSGSGSQGIAIPPRKAALEIIKPVITSEDLITPYHIALIAKIRHRSAIYHPLVTCNDSLSSTIHRIWLRRGEKIPKSAPPLSLGWVDLSFPAAVTAAIATVPTPGHDSDEDWLS